MAMRTVLVGANGMLGREVRKICPAPSLNLASWELDITCKQAVRATLQAYRPNVVINCAGLTKHRTPEPNADEYRRVNTYGPLLLARECDRIGARLVHVSTDCVFSGDRPIEDGPYTEVDEPDATDPYGASKAAGEIRGAPHLTVRCSFVGNGERGLIADLRRNGELASRQWPLWRNVWWSGSTAPAIARALIELAQRPEITGLRHLDSHERINKADLCRAIWDAGLARDVGSKEVSEPVVNRWIASLYGDLPALPPLYEALKELAR